MRRVARVDINGRAKFSKARCRAGMIEVDVTEKHMANVLGCEPILPSSDEYSRKSIPARRQIVDSFAGFYGRGSDNVIRPIISASRT